MILSNIKDFFLKNKKTIFFISFFLIIFFSFTDFSFAEQAGNIKAGDTTAQTIAKGANEFLGVVSLFTGLITYLATMFLSPEWVNGSLFGMNDKFHIIWIMVSNLVYLIFAFLLIWIAFMNIIGKNTDQYQLKQALPKFIVGVLIVPFSWFLVQFILSLSAILTISAVSLPKDTFPDFDNGLNLIEIPKICKIDISSEKKEGEMITCEEGKVKISELISAGNSSTSIYGVLGFYTHGVMGIDNIDKIKIENIGTIKTIADVAMKLVFDILFIAIYFILLVALGLVLMIRGIYIWIYMMLSPVFGLMYFFDKKEGGEGFFAKFNLKEFIALAMVPVYTMLALSFGMLFIYIVGTGMPKSAEKSSTSGGFINVSETKEGSTMTVGTKPNQIKYTIVGATGTQGSIMNGIGTLGATATGAIGALILKLFSIVVLWGSVMAAMRTSQITKTIVEPLHQFGTKVGQIASSAPGYIPIFGGQSMKSMSAAASNVSSTIESHQSKKGLKLAEPFMGGSEKDKKYRKLNTNAPADGYMAHRNVEEIISVGKTEDIASNSQAISGLVKNIQKMIDDGLITNNNEVQKAMEKLKAGKGNPQAIREALATFDKNSTNDNFTVLGGSKKITDAGQIDNYTGSNVIKSSSSSTKKQDFKFDIDPVVYQNILAKKEGTFGIGGEDAGVINDEGITEIATLINSQLLSNGMVGKFTSKELSTKIMSDLLITDNKVIDLIIKEMKKKK